MGTKAEDEEELDKETVGRKVSCGSCPSPHLPICLARASLVPTLSGSPHVLDSSICLSCFSPLYLSIHLPDSVPAWLTCLSCQVVEELPARQLEEFREIFSFFDR